MDQNFDNTQDNQETTQQPENGSNAGQQQYTDPNAGQQQYQYQGNYYYNAGPNPNQQYQPNYQQGYEPGMDQSPLSMGEWILTILVMMIPCVGLIIYLVWAFGKNGNVNRRNYCRAYLIIYAVILVISILFVTVFGAALFSTFTYY
nr:hypothetical protein [uncultured Merdimonas sp.]